MIALYRKLDVARVAIGLSVVVERVPTRGIRDKLAAILLDMFAQAGGSGAGLLTMRAACNLRVFSLAQRDADTIESQRRVLPEFVARRGWTLARPIDTYVDDGRSASGSR